jgi:hypothetical protein
MEEVEVRRWEMEFGQFWGPMYHELMIL